MVIAGAVPCVPLIICTLVGVMIRRDLGGINFIAYEDEIRFFNACRVAAGKRVGSGAVILVYIPAGVAAKEPLLRFRFLGGE